MIDHRVTLGEYTQTIQAHTPLSAADLVHVTRLYHEEVPLWLVLAGLLVPGVEFKLLATTLIQGQKEAV